MSTPAAQFQSRPAVARRSAAPLPVPRVFQAVLIAYVLLTGDLLRGAQAAFFGLQGGGGTAFVLAVLVAIAVDIARIAPVMVYARHPLGILHPLILTTVLWPLLVTMPATIDELGGFGGLLLGEPVSPPFYTGLGWLPGPEIWRAVAWTNLCDLVSLLCIYAGYALVHDGVAARAVTADRRREFDSQRIRTLALVLIGLSIAVLFVLIELRGGLASHLADMAQGRFRSMAGLGPLVGAVDLGQIALVVWVAARPNDAKQPLFIALMVAVAAAEFVSNGARSAAFAVFMMVGLAWALRNRRIPWRLSLILVPVFFLLIGGLNIIRTAGFTGETASEAIQDTDSGQVLQRAQEEIQLRQSLQSSVPIISQGHEVMNGPLWGSTYTAAIFAGVPRWIWPNKPRGPGSLYAQNFFGEVREGMAIPVTPAAEEYWNFGILGVILISLLYGAIIRRVHNFYAARQDNPFVLCAFVVFVTSFRPDTDDLVAVQQQAMWLALMLGLAVLFAMRKRAFVPSEPRISEAVPMLRPHTGG